MCCHREGHNAFYTKVLLLGLSRKTWKFLPFASSMGLQKIG